MDYPTRRRRYVDYVLNEDVDPPVLVERVRQRTLYEWAGPDAVYRSPDPNVLDLKRWAIEDTKREDREEDRSTQPPLGRGA